MFLFALWVLWCDKIKIHDNMNDDEGEETTLIVDHNALGAQMKLIFFFFGINVVRDYRRFKSVL